MHDLTSVRTRGPGSNPGPSEVKRLKLELVYPNLRSDFPPIPLPYPIGPSPGWGPSVKTERSDDVRSPRALTVTDPYQSPRYTGSRPITEVKQAGSWRQEKVEFFFLFFLRLVGFVFGHCRAFGNSVNSRVPNR